MLKNKHWVAVVAACVLSMACSASIDEENGGESVAAEGQELNAACGTFPAQFTYTGRLSPTLVTSAYSRGCDRNSIIFDINRYNSGFNPLMAPFLSPNVQPTNAAACQNMTLRYYVWEKTSTQAVLIGSKSVTGVWNPGGGLVSPTCEFSPNGANGLSSPVALQSGRDYRFGVTVRNVNTPVALRVDHNFLPR